YHLDEKMAGQPGRVVISVNLSRSPYDSDWRIEIGEIHADLIEGRQDRLSMLIEIDKFFGGAVHAYLRENTTEWSWYKAEQKQFVRSCKLAIAAFDAAAAEQQQIEQVKAMSIEFAHRASEGEFEADTDLSAEMPEELDEPARKVWCNVRQLVALGEVEPSWG